MDLLTRGTFWVHMVAYWGTGLAYLIFEKLIASKSFIARYKIQPNKSVTGPEIIKLCKVVLGNQALILVSLLLIRKLQDKFKAVRAHFDEIVSRPVPSIPRILMEWVVSLGCFEAIFYVFHYTLHRPQWYKQIHKQHHEFKAPLALASEYAHPAEFVLSNILPGAVGPLIMKSHPISTWFWLSISIFMTNTHHSGFIWPWYPANGWTTAHDYHHYLFSDQMGVVGFMDWFFDTSGGPDYNAYKRSAVLRSAFGPLKRAGTAALTAAAACSVHHI